MRLAQLRPSKAVVDIALLWAQILAAWTAAAFLDLWWVTAVAAVLVGNRFYSLFIIGHDGLHRRLHPHVAVNDLINDWCILGAIGAVTRINRRNHMTHHGSLATPHDPDWFKFASRRHLSPIGYIYSLTGLPFVTQAVRNVFAGKRVAPVAGERYSARDLLILVAWQGALLVGLTAAFGWWGYLVMWWLPVYLLTFSADVTRVFCEHSVNESAPVSLADRLITFEASRLELAIFAPMNMNYHTAHHLWPSVPYYNLPRASELLHSRLQHLPRSAPPPRVRVSYLSYLRRYLGKPVFG